MLLSTRHVKRRPSLTPREIVKTYGVRHVPARCSKPSRVPRNSAIRRGFRSGMIWVLS